jgi:hypothetical protein
MVWSENKDNVYANGRNKKEQWRWCKTCVALVGSNWIKTFSVSASLLGTILAVVTTDISLFDVVDIMCPGRVTICILTL